MRGVFESSVIVGSVVQLNSGGPKMTVHSIDEDVVVCRWAVGSAIREKEFHRMEIAFEEKDFVELTDAALALEMIETLTTALGPSQGLNVIQSLPTEEIERIEVAWRFGHEKLLAELEARRRA